MTHFERLKWVLSLEHDASITAALRVIEAAEKLRQSSLVDILAGEPVPAHGDDDAGALVDALDVFYGRRTP